MKQTVSKLWWACVSWWLCDKWTPAQGAPVQSNPSHATRIAESRNVYNLRRRPSPVNLSLGAFSYVASEVKLFLSPSAQEPRSLHRSFVLTLSLPSGLCTLGFARSDVNVKVKQLLAKTLNSNCFWKRSIIHRTAVRHALVFWHLQVPLSGSRVSFCLSLPPSNCARINAGSPIPNGIYPS